MRANIYTDRENLQWMNRKESSCNKTRIDDSVGGVESSCSIAGMFRTRSIYTKPIVDAARAQRAAYGRRLAIDGAYLLW